MKTINLFCILSLISYTPGYAQVSIPQIINSAGGSIQKQGYIFNWSVGELSLVNQMNSADGSYLFTNGFIQPEDQDAAVNKKTEIDFSKIKIFPNPTHDILEIDFFQKSTSEKIKLQLSDNAGRIVYTHDVSFYKFGFVERINMKDFPNGSYTLQIKVLNSDSGQIIVESDSYKIIKL
jgi:hypothetical protein